MDQMQEFRIPIFNEPHSDHLDVYHYQIQALMEQGRRNQKLYMAFFITMFLGLLSIGLIIIFVKPDTKCVVPTKYT